MISIKSKKEINHIKKACHIAASTLVEVESIIIPGISTEEIDRFCADFISGNRAFSSALNYCGFRKSVCTSINNVVCHGIPNKKDVLKEGDIISVDVAVNKNGYHGDMCKTFRVGKVSPDLDLLVRKAEESLMEGIKEAKHNTSISNIGSAISELIEKTSYSVVEGYGGHGIGKELHEPPFIPSFRTEGIILPKLLSGMVITIEPMINLGSKDTKILGDGWTVVTKDGKASAQFEHTILITKDGPEILTKL